MSTCLGFMLPPFQFPLQIHDTWQWQRNQYTIRILPGPLFIRVCLMHSRDCRPQKNLKAERLIGNKSEWSWFFRCHSFPIFLRYNQEPLPSWQTLVAVCLSHHAMIQKSRVDSMTKSSHNQSHQSKLALFASSTNNNQPSICKTKQEHRDITYNWHSSYSMLRTIDIDCLAGLDLKSLTNERVLANNKK